MLAKAVIALGIPAVIVVWFWYKYADPMWIVAIPFGVIIALVIAVGFEEER